MIDTKYLIIISIIISLFLCYFTIKDDPEVYTFHNNKHNNNLTLLIIAGVHGNEKAGPYTLKKLIKDGFFTYNSFKKIIIIPVVNSYGYKHNSRYQNSLWNRDINRNFYTNTTDYLANFIINHVKEADAILDFHEGWGYHLQNNESIGSTITSNEISEYTQKIVDILNTNIIQKHKKFSLRKNMCEIENSLACYISKNYNHKLYLLVETTGQNNIQPMKIRYNQIKTIISYILN